MTSTAERRLQHDGKELKALQAQIMRQTPKISLKRFLRLQICFSACSALALLLLITGCEYQPPGDAPTSNRIMSMRLFLQAMAGAANAMAGDCGWHQLKASELPRAFLHNPGWNGWNGPYLEDVSSTDSWETPVKFALFGRKLSIMSAGPDRKFGTSDDIIVETVLPE